MKKLLQKIFGKAAAKPQPREMPAPLQRVRLTEAEGTDEVIFKNLVLFGADGKPLVTYGDMVFKPGDRVMLSGAAGSGKSAGLAALRNAWLLGGSGDITVPPEVRFVPQEDYFPDRSLRGIICAPDPVTKYTTEQVLQALNDAGLGEFAPALDDATKRGEYWKNTLSGGQKNKLGFAGIFLHAAETKVLIVDEITAALDAKSEAELYPRLLDRMKHGIVISVAHHSTLAPQHNVFAHVADRRVTYGKTPVSATPSPAIAPPAPK